MVHRITASHFAWLLVMACMGFALGCSSTPKNKAAGKVSATDEQIFIGDTVEKNYDPNVIMKRAETFFDKEEYAEAVIEYQHFLDLHRVHTLASYAQFKLGESHFKMIKTIDRDMEPVRKAQETFEKLLREFPGNKYQGEARDRIRSCHDYLAQAHYFVGKFYLRREAYLAAAHRFESILKEYPEMEVAADATYDLAFTYHAIGADNWAQEKLIALEQQYPNHKHKLESQKLYASLKVTEPATAIARAGSSSDGIGSSLAASNGPTSSLTASDFAAASLASSNGVFLANASAPEQPAQPVMTLAAARVPGGGAGLSVPANSLSPTPAAFSPQTTLCRLGAWC
jgi:outer membrane protein assembly factor BamD